MDNTRKLNKKTLTIATFVSMLVYSGLGFFLSYLLEGSVKQAIMYTSVALFIAFLVWTFIAIKYSSGDLTENQERFGIVAFIASLMNATLCVCILFVHGLLS